MAEITRKAHQAIKMAEDHALPLAFAFQLTRKDLSFALTSNKYTGKSAIFIAEDFVNMFTGRILGETFFPAVSNYPATFNLNNAWNTTTEIGVIMWLLHQAGFASSRIGSIGASIAVGGALGGIFDDPIASSTSLTGPGINAYPVANYSSSARSGIGGSSVPWTHP